MSRAQELLDAAGENGVTPLPWNYTDAANAALYDDNESGFYWTPGNIALAVEAVNALSAYEAAALDVELLAKAIDASWAELLAPLGGQSAGVLASAERVAAEYARLRDEVPA